MSYSSLATVLKDVEFPASKTEIIDQVGSREVIAAEGEIRPIRELLNDCPANTFSCASEVAECPHIAHKIEGMRLMSKSKAYLEDPPYYFKDYGGWIFC